MKLFDFKYTDTIDFSSPFSLSESIIKLSGLVKKPSVFQKFYLTSALSNDNESQLLGEVSRNHVVLVRSRSAYVNRAKPIFLGNFHENGDSVILRGAFVIGKFQKIATILSAIIVWTLEAVLVVSFFVNEDSSVTLFHQTIVILFIPTVYIVGKIMGKLFFKNAIVDDISWISGKIKLAFSK